MLLKQRSSFWKPPLRRIEETGWVAQISHRTWSRERKEQAIIARAVVEHIKGKLH